MIQVGDTIPPCTLAEFISTPTEGCSLGPNPVDLTKAAQGKRIAVLAVPGAFTPTCSAQHLPAFVQQQPDFKAAGVDEIWCLSVNDAFVMGAWGEQQNVGSAVRMLADGSAAFAQATGLTLDLTAMGLGLRSLRYSMLVEDGRVVKLNVEEGGKLQVSTAEILLEQAREVWGKAA